MVPPQSIAIVDSSSRGFSRLEILWVYSASPQQNDQHVSERAKLVRSASKFDVGGCGFLAEGNINIDTEMGVFDG